MRVEIIDIEQTKSEAKKCILNKVPLVSKVFQFNDIVSDIKLEYIEFKVLKYEVVSSKKNYRAIKNNQESKIITILVNTYNGRSKSIDKMPNTINKYISKSCIKESKIDENDMINVVKQEIINNISTKLKQEYISEIKIVDIKSVYKPYWIADFRGRDIFID